MRCIPAAVTLLWLACTGPPARADEPGALRAPARVLPAADPAEEPESAPVVVEAKYPQYRSVGPAAASPRGSDADAAALRFLMPLPDRVVLLQVAVYCDGVPYGAQRRQRAIELLTLIEEAASAKHAAADSENAASGENSEPEVASAPAAPSATAEPDAAEKGENDVDEATNPTGADEAASEAAPVDSSVRARLQRYAQAKGRSLSVAEVEWFLTNWTDGHAVLVLREGFERVRAMQRPVLTVLDADNSGSLSDDELKAAEERFVSCDANRDGVLSYAELFSAADGLARTRPVRTSAATNPTFLLPVDGLSWPEVERRVLPLYGANSELPRGLARFDTDDDRLLGASEIERLASEDADIVLRVEFDGNDASQSHIVLVHLVDELGKATAGEPSGSAMILPVESARIEFSAVVGPQSGSDQVSFGAVHDGYPLLPLLDADGDGRITLRELRGAERRLRTLDRNADAAVSAVEIVPTLRVAIGRGPCVHQHLTQLRSAATKLSQPSVPVPDWFARMDANGDGDLTRSEFLGNDQQFATLDRDGDGLIDVTEAAIMEN